MVIKRDIYSSQFTSNLQRQHGTSDETRNGALENHYGDGGERVAPDEKNRLKKEGEPEKEDVKRVNNVGSHFNEMISLEEDDEVSTYKYAKCEEESQGQKLVNFQLFVRSNPTKEGRREKSH